MKKYFREYTWSNLLAMMKNQRLGPEICTADFTDRLVIITGATSGIGYVTAKKFASHGAEILCINRNEEKSKALSEELENEFGVKCSYLIADFSKLGDVHAIGKQLTAMDRKIDVLIHNAGVFVTFKTITDDNLEMVFQTNYLSTFILNNYLKKKFKDQMGGRIIFVNSEAHRFAMWGLNLDDLNWDKHPYTGLRSYGAAKLAQILSMTKLTEYFEDSGPTVNAMHPGNVKTNSGQNNGPIYKIFKRIFVDSTAKPLENSAEALYYLGASKKLENISGKFFNLTTQEEPAPPALDREAAEKLWTLSHELAKLS